MDNQNNNENIMDNLGETTSNINNNEVQSNFTAPFENVQTESTQNNMNSNVQENTINETVVPEVNNNDVVNTEQTTINTSINNSEQLNSNAKKKKFKWWIALIIFLASFVIFFIRMMLIMFLKKQNVDESIIGIFDKIFSLIMYLCWLSVLPVFIITLVMYLKRSDKEVTSINNEIINTDMTIDDKLIRAYVGKNYDKINAKKFSFPSLFFNYIYALYRKYFIIFIIILLISSVFANISETIYYLIYFVSSIVLGINFNKWYIKYATNQVNKIKNDNPNMSEDQLINLCSKKGGTSVGMIFIGIIIIGIIIICVLGTILSSILK